MDLGLHVQISLSGHRGESMGEDEVVPLREYVPHHFTLRDSTFPGYPYGLMNADRIARVRGVGNEHRFTSKIIVRAFFFIV